MPMGLAAGQQAPAALCYSSQPHALPEGQALAVRVRDLQLSLALAPDQARISTGSTPGWLPSPLDTGVCRTPIQP